jgi:hypothetical protein
MFVGKTVQPAQQNSLLQKARHASLKMWAIHYSPPLNNNV